MPVASQPNETFALMRSLFFYAAFMLTTLLLGILSLPAMILQLSGIMTRVAVLWGKACAFYGGMQLEILHPEKAYLDGTVIIIANHQSGIDIPAFYKSMPVPFTWMAKASVFKVPIIGWAMKAMRCIPVERNDRKKAMESLYHAAEMINEGRNVVIFPEATFGYPDGSLRPFKKGSFVLAKMAEVVLQPVTIWGTAHVAPDVAQHSLQRFYPGKASLIFHDPIMPDEYASLEADELSDKLRAVIEAPIADLQKSAPLTNQLRFVKANKAT